MTPLPLVVTCRNDFAHHLIPATDESTIDEIIAIAAPMVIGVRVPAHRKNVRLRRIEETTPLDGKLTATQARLQFMDWLELDYDD